MQWWLTAEPKDQDLPKARGLQLKVWLSAVQSSRENTNAYLRVDVRFLKLENHEWTQLKNFSSKWWKKFKFWSLLKGEVVEVEVENRMI